MASATLHGGFEDAATQCAAEYTFAHHHESWLSCARATLRVCCGDAELAAQVVERSARRFGGERVDWLAIARVYVAMVERDPDSASA